MLDPTFLIAATINEDGRIELPAVQYGIPSSLIRALFEPDEAGGFVQWVPPRTAPQPLDMTFFARCLSCRFGALTPELFAVRGHATTGGLRGRLVHTDAASEEARLRLLRNAFLVHLTAYEEHLI